MQALIDSFVSVVQMKLPTTKSYSMLDQFNSRWIAPTGPKKNRTFMLAFSQKVHAKECKNLVRQKREVQDP